MLRFLRPAARLSTFTCLGIASLTKFCSSICLITLVLGVFAAMVHAEQFNINEFVLGNPHPILSVLIQGNCPNTLAVDADCKDTLKFEGNPYYTTPDGRFTIVASWYARNLGGRGGVETLNVTVIDNTGESGTEHTIGVGPAENFVLVGSPQPLSAYGSLTGTCAEGVGYGSAIDDRFSLNGGFTTPGQVNGLCGTPYISEILIKTPPVLPRPWFSPNGKPTFNPEVDFTFAPGSLPHSIEDMEILAKFGTSAVIFE